MSKTIEHAMAEFRAAGWWSEETGWSDEMQEELCKGVLDLLNVFSEQGHSGSSAPYAVNVFKKLAMWEPIAPLTGEDWEWVDHGDGLFQNKRCGAVFKDTKQFGGQAYHIDAKVFWEWGMFEGEAHKNHYTSFDSRQPIVFPYTPKTEYVFVPTEGFPNEILS